DALPISFTTYPNAAIIAPVISKEEGSDTASFRPPVIYGEDSKKYVRNIAKDVYSVQFASGALAMWRMQHMKKVGFFDPAIFLFYEDDDISLRTKKAGYDLLLLSGINVQHIPGHSCPLTEDIRKLKLRSSTWSFLYITAKCRGLSVARSKARFMVIKHSILLFLSKLHIRSSPQKLPGELKELE